MERLVDLRRGYVATAMAPSGTEYSRGHTVKQAEAFVKGVMSGVARDDLADGMGPD